MSEIEIKDVMYKVSKRNMRSCHPGSVPRKVRYFSCPKYTSVESLKAAFLENGHDGHKFKLFFPPTFEFLNYVFS